MMMKQYQFKTNINCGGCVTAVTRHLNENKEIVSWNVDTANPDKVLTVQTEKLDASQVKQLVEEAGFNAQPL
jgi:copper chaperone